MKYLEFGFKFSDDYLHNQYNSERVKGTFGKPSFFENVKEEYWACKEHVCLIDMSSFTKTEVKVRSTKLLCFDLVTIEQTV